MRVYCEGSGEMMEVEVDSADEAAEEVHLGNDDDSGNEGAYRVEEEPGEWVRYTVRVRHEPFFTTRGGSPCDPPELDE